VDFKSLIAIRLLLITAMAFIAVSLGIESRAQTPDKAALVGAWTLDPQLSDRPAARDERGDPNDRPERRGYGGGGRRGGGFGRGGFGGGGQGRGSGDRQDMARTRDALRDVLNPPDRLTITQTDSMVIVTGADGRTMRLSPDGTKIKDENTKVERKTRWDAGMLVSEVSGLGPKITQTFTVTAAHQLRITVHRDGKSSDSARPGQNQARDFTYIYDPETPQ
jgi:hypothetical protein